MPDQTEIDKLMERSRKHNEKIKARQRLKSQAKFSATSLNSVERTANIQWKFLFDNLASAIEQITFDPHTDPTPKTRVTAAHDNLMVVMDGIQKNNITRLGRFNIRSEIGTVANSLRGIQHGLKNKQIKAARLEQELPKLVSKLHTVAAEVSVRVQKAMQDAEISDINRRREEIEKANTKVAVASNTTDKKKRYADITAAMQTLIANSRKANEDAISDEKLQDNLTNLELPQKRETFEFRDADNIVQLRELLNTERPKFVQQLIKTGLTKDKEMPFALMQGVVYVRTERQINEAKLKQSGMRYKIITYPGVKKGAHAFQGRGQREFIPHDFVLLDQLFIAFNTNPSAMRGKTPKQQAAIQKKREPLKLTRELPLPPRKKDAKSAGESKTYDASGLREQVHAIIEQKLGRKFTDVLLLHHSIQAPLTDTDVIDSSQIRQEIKVPMRASLKKKDKQLVVSEAAKTFLRTKATPGISYVWLMPTKLYGELLANNKILDIRIPF